MREKGEPGAVEIKVIMSGKIVAFLAQILGKLILGKIFTQMLFLANVVAHFQVLSVTFIEYGQ